MMSCSHIFIFSPNIDRFSGRGRTCCDQLHPVVKHATDGTPKGCEHHTDYVKPWIAAGNAALSRHGVFLRSRSHPPPVKCRAIIREPGCPPEAANTMAAGAVSMPLDMFDANSGHIQVGALIPIDLDAQIDSIEVIVPDSPVEVSSDDSKDCDTQSPTGF
jgi:hypothetical protein